MNDDECFLVSINAYHRINPDSFFRRSISEEDVDHLGNTLVFLGFNEFKEFAKSEKEYYVVLKLIEKNIERVCEFLFSGKKRENFQKVFEDLKKEVEEEVLNDFAKFFKEEMNKLNKI
ncbi:MAG: hypothetical protein GTN76_06815 [Candidatus Aenigmarchaeota archaeon]|nr:hypothetical protein [Candidatus Aenigmarchaeota archaeon]